MSTENGLLQEQREQSVAMLQQMRELGAQLRDLGAQLRDQGTELREVKEQLHDQGAQLREVKEQLHDQGAQLRAELRDQGAQLRTELRDQGEQLRTELRDQGAQLREVKDQLLELKGQRAQRTVQGERAQPPAASGSGTSSPGAGSGASSPARRALAVMARGAGGGGGSGLSGVSTGSSKSGSSPPSPAAGGQASPGGAAKLRAAFAAAPPPVPALALALGADSRSLPAAVQAALLAHRLRTPTRVQDFDFVPVSYSESTVLPDARRGFSVFLVASLDAEVVRLAHELRSAASKGNVGCISQPLASLPASLVLTIDSVLEGGGGSGVAPIVWHATVSPAAPMLLSAFEAAFCGWAGASPCWFKAGGERPEEASGDEGEALDLTCLSARSAAYAATKLAAHAAALGSAAAALPAGGSPG